MSCNTNKSKKTCLTYDQWNKVDYKELALDPSKFSMYGINFKAYNFDLAEDEQDPRWVHQYCYEALTKYKDETCLNVKLACVRHIIDMQRAKTEEFKYMFSPMHAFKAIDFYKFLSHVKATSGQFKLLPWQQFIVGSIFGWVQKEPKSGKYLRRFRDANVFVARKNGKSTLACGIALYMMLADGEVGADIFTTGPSGKQARIVFEDAKKMLKASVLGKSLDLRMNNDAIICDSLNARFEPKNSIADNLDGLNSHFACVDEIHSFKKADVYNVMKTSIGSRLNPLFFVISTAGTNLGCIGHQVFLDCEKILTQIAQPQDYESTFCALYTTDKGDNWLDETVWRKANPSLRSGARKMDDLVELSNTCLLRPSQQANFFTKYLNVFVQSTDKWLSAQTVEASADFKLKIEDYYNTKTDCYVGVDIGLNSDLSAISLVFHQGNEFKVFTKAFFPYEALNAQSVQNQQLYHKWNNQKDGSFEFTDGATCDFDVLYEELKDACRLFNVKTIELDPWNANQLHRDLTKIGLPATLRPQSKGNLNEPTKFFERLIIERDLKHSGSGVMEWCLRNACISIDRNDCVSVEKDNKGSEYKIDCVKAAITALAGFVYREDQKASTWDTFKPRAIGKKRQQLSL